MTRLSLCSALTDRRVQERTSSIFTCVIVNLQGPWAIPLTLGRRHCQNGPALSGVIFTGTYLWQASCIGLLGNDAASECPYPVTRHRLSQLIGRSPAGRGPGGRYRNVVSRVASTTCGGSVTGARRSVCPLRPRCARCARAVAAGVACRTRQPGPAAAPRPHVNTAGPGVRQNRVTQRRRQ